MCHHRGSYVYAALGIALVVLGIACIAFGEDTEVQIIGVAVAVIGVVQIVFGGLRRATEDVTTTDSEAHAHPHPH